MAEARAPPTWAAAAQAEEYIVEIATDAAFTQIVSSQTVTATSHTPHAQLAASTVYFWRVRPVNACGTGSSSAVRRFITEGPPGECGLGTSTHVVFSDDVESGPGAWTTSNVSGTANWAISTARPYGGTGSAWLAQDPAEESHRRLTSPPITLPSGKAPLTLQFQSDQSLESRVPAVAARMAPIWKLPSAMAFFSTSRPQPC